MIEQERYRGCVDENGNSEWSAFLNRWRTDHPYMVTLDQWDKADAEWYGVLTLSKHRHDPEAALLAAAAKLEDLARHCTTMAQSMREQSATINARLEQRAQIDEPTIQPEDLG